MYLVVFISFLNKGKMKEFYRTKILYQKIPVESFGIIWFVPLEFLGMVPYI